MTGIQRELCTQCGEPASLDARICPHCRNDLLVGVAVDQSIPEGRERYRIAREVMTLGLPGLSLRSVQTGLGSPGTPLAAGLTRAAARLLTATLHEHGVSASLQYAAPSAPRQAAGGGRVWRLALGVVVVAGLSLAAYQAWLRVGPGAAGAAATQQATRGPALSTRELAQRAGPSAVSVACSDSMGAGFFVAPDLILTNEHVTCKGETLLTITRADGKELAGEVTQADPWLDLALVRVLSTDNTPLELGDATQLAQGDEVVLIGSPRGLEFSLAEGVISSVERNHYGVGYLQVDANVNPGNSGGPLLDRRGRVVGIVSMMVSEASGLGLALPVNYAYAGEEALLGEQPPEYDTSAWASRLVRAAELDEEEVVRVSQTFGSQLGGLVNLSRRGSGVYVATVARRFADYPAGWRVSLSLWQDRESLCGRTYTVKQWRNFEDYARGEDVRFLQWMESRGLAGGLYFGFVELNLRRECPLVDWGLTSELRLGQGHGDSQRLSIPAGG